ncbi:MAG: response regulator [Deltaproteobacteria bacterium]|nr:response regulator [Deltaproteobacteria bacterium]
MSASSRGGPVAPGRRPRSTPGTKLRQINAALVELSGFRARFGDDLSRAFRAMTEVAARGIGVERASIWLVENNGALLVCRDLYEVTPDRHGQSDPLPVDSYPKYFSALSELRVMVAHDVRRDERSAEFGQSYFEPQGIGAMLDAPTHHQGQLVGVVCLEHVGGPRTWTAEEEGFAGSVADQLALLLQSVERRRAEDALRASEQRLEDSLSLLSAALESTADGILIVDQQGQVRGHNQKFLSLWRLSEAAVKDGNDAELQRQVLGQLRQPERFTKKVRELYEQPEAESFDVLDLRDGRVYERYSKPQRLEGRTIGRVWSFRDVTERRRHEEEAQVLQAELFQAQKIEAIGTLAGGIAHDFNNILGVILGHTAVARADLGQDHPVADNLKEINDAAERARALVEQILTFSRRRPEARQPMALSPVVEEALRLLRASLPASIEIDFTQEGEGFVVMADVNQVHQVLMNLGTNASHAMRAKGGRLAVAIRSELVSAATLPPELHLRPGRYVLVAVSDTGHGIPPEVLPHVFEPFFTTKGQGEGTGLGLAVAQSIMQNHEGAVVVKSEVGIGSTFELYFPEVDLEAAASEPMPHPVPEGQGQRILMVDDEPQLVASATRLLEKLHYRVTGCTSAADALATFRAAPDDYDLLVTDLSMPKLDGLALAREVHLLRPELPVVLTSGFFGELEPGSTTSAGIRTLLTKPFHPRSLAESVARALGLR